MSAFISALPLQDDKKHGSMGGVNLPRYPKIWQRRLIRLNFYFGLERLFNGN